MKNLSDSTHVALLMKYSKNHNTFEFFQCTIDKRKKNSENKITYVDVNVISPS
jgi:hypothetical protein